MRTRQTAMLCALAMLASLFLPWIVTPIGSNLVPWQALPAFDRAVIEDYIRSAPPQTLVFLGSFLLAALFVLLAIVGGERRSLAILTGAGPLGLAALAVWNARDQLGLAEMEGSLEDMAALIDRATAVLGAGGWTWILAAMLLFLIGLFDPGRPKPKPVTASRW